MGRHREAQLLPKVGGSAAAGDSLAADLHQCGAAQPHNSAVSVFSGRAAGRRAHVHGKARVCECVCVFPPRLPSISLLNGSVVTDVEREDAERFFIRYYLDYPEEELPCRCTRLKPHVHSMHACWEN